MMSYGSLGTLNGAANFLLNCGPAGLVWTVVVAVCRICLCRDEHGGGRILVASGHSLSCYLTPSNPKVISRSRDGK